MSIARNWGFSCIGARRQLKVALEGHCAGEASETELLAQAGRLRAADQARQQDLDASHILGNDFSLYDHVLDVACMRRPPIPQRTRQQIEASVDLKAKTWSCCDGPLHQVGKTVTWTLDIAPAIFRVKVIRRRSYACDACDAQIVQGRRHRRARSMAAWRPRRSWHMYRSQIRRSPAVVPPSADIRASGNQN